MGDQSFLSKVETTLDPVLTSARRHLWQPARADMPPPPGRIEGHIQITDSGVWGWYWMTPTGWVGLSDRQVLALVQAEAARYADLTGRAAKVLVSPWPWDTGQWIARRLHRATRAHPRYRSHIEDCAARGEELGLFDTVPMIGVRLAGKRAKDRDRVAEIDREVCDSLGVLPISPHAMAWRLHRSAAPGIDPPREPGVEVWEPEDLAAIGRVVRWEASGFDPMVRVVAERDGVLVERWVAVLTVGRMAGRDIAEDEPWITRALRYPWVDVCLSMTVHDGEDLVKDARRRHGFAADNIEHLERSELPVPLELHEKVDRSAELLSELSHGDDGSRSNGRVRMVARFAVSADTRAECRERLRLLRNTYRRPPLSIQLVHDWGSQAAALWEFMPGRAWQADAFVRQMRLDLAAHALPNASTSTRYIDGEYLGYTTGAFPDRPVCHDGHRLMRQGQQRAGLYPVLGDPGAGKSSLLATLLVKYTLAGVKSRVWDPAGGLAQLANIPEIADQVAVIEIGKAAPGTLHIPRLLPDPRREVFVAGPDGDRAWAEELERTQGLRPELCTHVLLQLLPAQVRTSDAYLAVTEASAVGDGDPDVALAWLYGHGHAQLARVIEQSKRGHGRLLFAPPDGAEASPLPDATLVVITMGGIAMPVPGTRPEDWSPAELTANAALMLTAYYARRFLYEEDPGTPKVFVIDEVHRITPWKVGQSLVQGAIRMIRRLYIALYLSTQHPADIYAVDPEGEAFAGEGFIGWHEDPDAAAETLALFSRSERWVDDVCQLTVVDDRGGRLPGEFFYVTTDGGMTQFRVDQEYMAALVEHASTTPGEVWETDIEQREDQLCAPV